MIIYQSKRYKTGIGDFKIKVSKDLVDCTGRNIFQQLIATPLSET